MNKIRKICAVTICGAIVIRCCILGFRVPRVLVNGCLYPALENYSVRVVDAVPESFHTEFVDAMWDYMDVVEITWNFTNFVNGSVNMKYVWIDYQCCGSRDEQLYVLEEKEHRQTVSYDPEILPLGEHITVREYVMVPKGMQEIKASLGANYGFQEEERIPREEFLLTF